MITLILRKRQEGLCVCECETAQMPVCVCVCVCVCLLIWLAAKFEKENNENQKRRNAQHTLGTTTWSEAGRQPRPYTRQETVCWDNKSSEKDGHFHIDTHFGENAVNFHMGFTLQNRRLCS